MYTQYELASAINVESVTDLIPDPWPHTVVVRGIITGSMVAVFSVDMQYDYL